MNNRILTISLTILLALTLTGCGNPQETARKKLAALNKNFSAKDFAEAAFNNDEMAVQLYLDAGMNVNEIGVGNQNALYSATMKGNVGIIKLLLDKGANPDLTFDMGDGKKGGPAAHVTPLMVALIAGEDGAAKLLLDGKANANYVDEFGENALMTAARFSRTNVIAALATKTKNINATNKAGDTAIDLAKDPQTVTELGKAGVNMLTAHFIKSELTALGVKAKDLTIKSCADRNGDTLMRLLIGSFAQYDSEGFNEQQMVAAGKITLASVKDGMWNYNMTTRTTTPTEEDLAVNKFEKELYSQVEAMVGKMAHSSQSAAPKVQKTQ